MIKELKTIEFLKPFLPKNSDIFEFFQILIDKNDFNTLYILNYLYKYICSDEVAKRKASATELEDFIAVVFDGVVADEQNRKNITFDVPNFFINAKDLLAKNRREKADILFKNSSLSIKTLIPSNKEINLGSFEKSVLFDGLGLESLLNERKSRSGIGLGSKSQFFQLLQIIKNGKSLKAFEDRFLQMVKFIFSDEILIGIKENSKFSLYFLTADELYNIFFNNLDDLSKIINRWEGNGLRVDRDIILKECKNKIILDFTILNNSAISLINEFDLELHKSFGKYFNSEFDKNIIIKRLEELFNEFEKIKSN